MVRKFPVWVTVSLKQIHHRKLHLSGISSQHKGAQHGVTPGRGLQPLEEGERQLPALGFHPLPAPAGGGNPCYNPHPTSCSALERKHLPALVPITISLGKKCISLAHPPVNSQYSHGVVVG